MKCPSKDTKDFTRHIERMGIYELEYLPDCSTSMRSVRAHGREWTSCRPMPIVTAPDGRAIAFSERIDDLGREGLGCGKGPYWSTLEVCAPAHHLHLVCASDELRESPDAPEEMEFHVVQVFWRSPRGVTPSSPVEGKLVGSRGGYRSERVGNSEYAYVPMLHLRAFLNDDVCDINVDPVSLAAYLACVLHHRPRPDAAKLPRLLVRFFHEADPASVTDAVKMIYDELPELMPVLVAILPAAIRLGHAEQELGLGWTVEQMSKQLMDEWHQLPLDQRPAMSESAIRSVIKELGLRPIASRKPYVYSDDDSELIRQTLIADHEARMNAGW